jgi:ArsR family transcriptional regulator, arsenate/arsenite/antimonite-responsive transcriptional repressor
MSTVLTPMSTEDPLSKRTKRDTASLQTPSDQTVNEIVQLFKLLADETRIRILYFLQQTDELNVRELCKLLRQRQPSVSHHLALLRVARLISMRRDGKHNFYRLVPTRLEEFIGLFSGTTPGQPARVCFEGFELRFTPPQN